MKADYKKIRRKLNIAIGQLEGVSKMVDENRYFIDISYLQYAPPLKASTTIFYPLTIKAA